MRRSIKKMGLGFFVCGVLFLGGNDLLFAQEPVGWYIHETKDIEGTEACLSTFSHTGKYSAYAKVTVSQKREKGWKQGWMYDIGSLLKPNSEYVLAGWVKTDLGKGSYVEFSCHLYDKSEEKCILENFHGYQSGKMHGVNNWTYKQVPIRTPDTIKRAVLLFIVHRQGEAWLDDVSLIEVSSGKNLLVNPGFEILKQDTTATK